MNNALLLYGAQTGFESYCTPGSILVTGQNKYRDPAYARARAAGAEVLAYVNVCSIPDIIKHDPELYSLPVSEMRWQPERLDYRDSAGSNSYLGDLRIGSKWMVHAVSHIKKLKDSGLVDGVLLDSYGPNRSNPLADWANAPADLKAAWLAGLVELARLLRLECGEDFIIVGNGIWPAAQQALIAPYTDGSMIEHHPFDRLSAVNAANYRYREFYRRVIWLARPDEWDEVIAVPGVTHVCTQQSYTADRPLPVVQFTDVRLAETLAARDRARAERVTLRAEADALVDYAAELEVEAQALEARLAEAQARITSLESQLLTVTGERDSLRATQAMLREALQDVLS